MRKLSQGSRQQRNAVLNATHSHIVNQSVLLRSERGQSHDLSPLSSSVGSFPDSYSSAPLTYQTSIPVAACANKVH